VRAHHALQVDSILRHAGLGLQVAVIDRQRKISERDARHSRAGLDQLVRSGRGQLRIERAGSQRSRDHEDFQRSHLLKSRSGLVPPI
jgi:hypothetical protein